MAKKTTTSTKIKNTSSASNKQSNKKDKPASPIVIFTCFVISILLAIFMYIDPDGIVNRAVKNFLMGIFGNIAYAIPISCFGMSIYLAVNKSLRKFRAKLLLLFLILWNVSSLTHLISANTGSTVLDAYNAGIENNGGGFLGAIAAYGLQKLFNNAAFIVLLLILFILISIFTQISLLNAISSIFRAIKETFTDIKNDADNIQNADNSEMAADIKRKLKNTSKSRNDESDKTSEILDISLDLPSDDCDFVESDSNSDSDIEVISVPDVETTTTPDIETKDVEIEQILFIDDTEELFSETDDSSDVIDLDINNLDIFNTPSDEITLFDTNDIDIPTDDIDVSDDEFNFEPEEFLFLPDDEPVNTELYSETPPTDEEHIVINDELEDLFDIPKEYEFPSPDLLAVPKTQTSDTREEMRETAARLIQTLKSFHVEAKLLQVTKGPSVTRYEIQIEAGTKFAKVESLSKDIALNLAAQNVLIAPVPDKAAIGIEVPNKEVASVYLRELIESEKFINAKSKLSFALGKDISGNVIVGDIAKMPHILIAGTTGSGKSVCTNTIITSFLYKARPDEVKLIMVDPKKVEFIKYDGIPHLLIPVVTDPKRAAAALNWATQEMDKRYNMFTEEGVKNIETYNAVMDKIGGKRMPQIVIIIDELADLMMATAKEVESCIVRLTQLARAAGIHLIIATQRPSVNVVTGLIKANMPSRIALFLSSQVDSRTILDRSGAEKLLGNGDMLYSPVGSRSPLRVQGAYISDEEIEKIVEFLKETSEQGSYSEDLAEHIERHANGENGVTPDENDDGDPLLPQAIELAVRTGQISTSMVQRKFSIGYARAGRIIDQMENRKIISGPNGSKPREVLITHMDLSE